MGKRGPQPGFKKKREAQASQPSTPAQVPEAAASTDAAALPIADVPAATPPTASPAPPERKRKPAPVLSAADRENPNKISGDALRELAHRRGMARSLLADMSDEKIREQLRYLTHRQYEDA